MKARTTMIYGRVYTVTVSDRVGKRAEWICGEKEVSTGALWNPRGMVAGV